MHLESGRSCNCRAYSIVTQTSQPATKVCREMWVWSIASPTDQSYSSYHAYTSLSMHISLQKQVGCFNHRVVTMVADKLKRHWLRGLLLVFKPKCIKQPNKQLPSSSYKHNTPTTLRIYVKESLQMHFKVYPGEGSTDVMRVFSVLWL